MTRRSLITRLACGLAILLASPLACSVDVARPSVDGHDVVARDSHPSGGTTTPCATPNGTEASIVANGSPLDVLCHGLYVEHVATPQERASIEGWYAEAVTEIASIFGPRNAEAPVVVVCVTRGCAVSLSGPTGRSHAQTDEPATVYINGIGRLTKGTIVHEMAHIEIARRRAGVAGARALPTWFEEGAVTFLGDNAYCPAGTPLAIDDLRRLSASYAWWNFTNQTGKLEPTYCQARSEIATWVRTRSREALVAAIDAIIAGGSIDDVYGPLLFPGLPFNPLRDGRFPLDEKKGSVASDVSGRPHAGTLVGNATWTTGHVGSGVRTSGGGHVRIDDFVEFGLPDEPFSISLWVNPRRDANVLVHASANADGTGWCMPILGHDAAGHLVGQVTWALRPNAFLTATGPVLAPGSWHHVLMSWAPDDGLRLYVDGSLAGSASPAADAQRHRDVPALPMHLLFGSDDAASCWKGAIEPGSWDGALDEIRVYNYALTAAEVVHDMTN